MHKSKTKIKLNLKLSVALEPVRVFSITTIIWTNTRLHIPFNRNATSAFLHTKILVQLLSQWREYFTNLHSKAYLRDIPWFWTKNPQKRQRIHSSRSNLVNTVRV